ncbi:KAR9-domain-containing protein, partial [Tothia fuscella]
MPELLLYDTPLSLSSSSSRSRQWHSAPRVVDVSTPEDRGQEVTAHSTTPQSQPRQPLTVKDPNTPIRSSERTLRKPSPGLIARLKLLDLRRRSSVVFAALVDQAEIGRIPESQLRLLEEQAKQKENRKVEIERRGRGWSAPASSALPPQLQLALPGVGGGDRESESFSSAMSAFVHESDASSIMSVSDRLMPSDSEAEDLHTDTQKYRLPAIGKSRGSSRNGFVLEDGSIASRDRDRPPTPPPKDPPSYRNSYIQNDADESRSTMTENSDLESYFNPSNLSRAGSVYTLSRASFANQLSQLTSIKLPQASSLSSSISAIPTSTGAARALNDASDQIRMWIKKASEVLNGLDAEDDVEWAAAGGREGLGDVDAAINRFETLIDVYVSAIEQLESRNDIDNLTAEELQGVVERMDRILKRWNQIKVTLKGVKEQVEVAMEWEELWNTVLGEIGQETEGISRMIFEMEERRHRGLLDAMAEPGAQLDIKELETIVEEAPSRAASAAAVTNGSPTSTVDKPAPHRPEEDKNLVGLFARMQPLRASLDFLPMRLSAFMTRAEVVFPTGCEELQRRQEFLEGKYKKLEADAESLRKELGEDRWVIIFRKASRQALKMCESVERSVTKLRDALDEGAQHTNPPALAKKIENYEAKKEHYGPAIQQVLAIIDKGVSTRLTVNGEILRLQGDMKRKWSELDAHTKALDFALDQLQINKGSSLRDSISTILSSQHSVASSSAGAITDTPGSSPASSVVFLGRRESNPSTPYAKSRQGSFASSTTARSQIGKRYSSMPNSMANSMGSGNQSNIPRKTPLSRSSVSELRPALGVSPRLYSTPTPRSVSRSESRTDNRSDRPRWNGSTNTGNTAIGHNFKPLSATIPSPYSKPPLRSVSTGQPSPLARSSFNSRPPSGMANQSRAP